MEVQKADENDGGRRQFGSGTGGIRAQRNGSGLPDYAVYAELAAKAVASGECSLGLLFCGTEVVTEPLQRQTGTLCHTHNMPAVGKCG